MFAVAMAESGAASPGIFEFGFIRDSSAHQIQHFNDRSRRSGRLVSAADQADIPAALG
jgi:hypothetical protein